MSVSLMTDCEKFDATTQTDSEGVQREIEALGVEFESGLITHESYADKLYSLQEEANIISTIYLDKDPSIADPSIAEPRIAEPSIAEPSIAGPSIAEPSIADPSIAGPSVAEPSVMSLIQANQERMNVMEKRIQELSEHCKSLEALIERKDAESYPDVERMYPEMYTLNHCSQPGPRSIPRSTVNSDKRYADLLPCNFKGVRYWHDGRTRLYDYTTYEFVGAIKIGSNNIILVVNPVYAVKYKERNPELFEYLNSQKQPHITTMGSSPAAIQVQLEEDEDLHLKTGVYSFKYEASHRSS